MSRRLLAVLLAAAVACSNEPPPPRPASRPAGPEGPFELALCALPRAQLERIRRGYHPQRSGEVQFLPLAGNYFGSRSHSGPWSFLQRVPLFLYGSGHVPPAGVVRRPVTLADVAPTLARHLGFRFAAPDGRPLPEAIAANGGPPRLVVTVVWDGGGRNVLDAHPHAWPVLRRSIPAGAWFDRATVGSSPSVTPASHTTLGTGAFPDRHGLVDLLVPAADRMENVEQVAPDVLLAPTLADRFDRMMGNRPLVGFLASGYALGMVGHGAALAGGDRDLAATEEEERWTLPPALRDAFRFPRFVGAFPGLASAGRNLDLEDGRRDGRWLGVDVADELERTPVFSSYQVDVVAALIRREGFGADAVPDLLFTNFKQIDLVGHRWGMHTPQMEAVVRSSDRALAGLIAVLDREVGRGRWVLVLTADHGSMPDASITGGFAIDAVELRRDLDRRFDRDGDGRDVIRALRVTQLWVNEAELAEHGGTAADVAAFLASYTERDNGGRRDRRVFATAFPAGALAARCR